MNVQEIRQIARAQGLRPGKRKKEDLIRAIQRQEGNFDCFGSAFTGECDQWGCRWRGDCFTTARRNPVG